MVEVFFSTLRNFLNYHSKSSLCTMKFNEIMRLLGIIICFTNISINFIGGSKVKNATSAVVRHLRAVNFPEGSATGIFFAIGIPLDIPDKSVSLAFYFEANYRLPYENTVANIEENFQVKGMSRKLVYAVIENKLERVGYSGRSCLMRAICEAASNSNNENGLVGDILRILLVPSTSKSENLTDGIMIAEYKKNCSSHYSECPMSLLDLISYYI